jgi:hypothetical protein
VNKYENGDLISMNRLFLFNIYNQHSNNKELYLDETVQLTTIGSKNVIRTAIDILLVNSHLKKLSTLF